MTSARAALPRPTARGRAWVDLLLVLLGVLLAVLLRDPARPFPT